MKFMFVIALFATSILADSKLAYPTPRGNIKWWGTCSAGAGCKGPCDSSMAEVSAGKTMKSNIIAERGQELTIKWGYANNRGGFVRIAMVPYTHSDSWDSFNRNVIKYACYESDDDCGVDPANQIDQWSTTINVPENIPDGMATIQWMWYGGGNYYGNPDAGFGEYYGCSDVMISGGKFNYQVKPVEFLGGDKLNPESSVCNYHGSNKIGDCNFGDKYPNPIPGNLLSNSLEPCNIGKAKTGKPYGF
ncbi:hypothetical protein AYI69_g93 [Smittium culicis]|uniref:Chitin-binding type-4 domain-containing protein n=1 Tax=Smittium culicis TaxID=133412 RepID=A0A1R1YTY9_9FUNG|nr:hypothetical protein AYI69_g93 [Smittium culicis]